MYSRRLSLVVCSAAMISLALAMGIGRFAFTPLFPLMLRDGILHSEIGALLAASNYLGYLFGALIASRVRVSSASLIAIGLISIVIVTGLVGLTVTSWIWVFLRFFAGLFSAWTLIATSSWGLRWLTSFGKAYLAGVIYAGVGLGIALAGLFCLLTAQNTSSSKMWIELSILAGIASLFPLMVSRYFPEPPTNPNSSVFENALPKTKIDARGIIICYGLFGFGYILPATYLPSLARQLMDDPQIFGWAWPIFGTAAALSTIAVSFLFRTIHRLHVWAVSHVVMAIGVFLPSVWTSMASVALAALFVGGTFMVITMIGMQEARSRNLENSTVILARLTSSFALGQLLGPIAFASIRHFGINETNALNSALQLAALCLLFSAVYLWRQANYFRDLKV